MSWRVAESLDVLLGQINQMFPNRSKASDGAIGDLRHQNERTSDHNPWVRDGSMGVVTARDFTNDPANGLDSEKLAEALRAGQDHRIKYIISNKKICSGIDQDHSAWEWRPYTGVNPHNHHVHVSVVSVKKLYDDTAPWVLSLEAAQARESSAEASEVDLTPVLRRGDQDKFPADAVHRLQTALNSAGAGLKLDGDFGVATKRAVEDLQTRSGLVADGVVGRQTWDLLNSKSKKGSK